jgi:hypothetical protein
MLVEMLLFLACGGQASPDYEFVPYHGGKKLQTFHDILRRFAAVV